MPVIQLRSGLGPVARWLHATPGLLRVSNHQMQVPLRRVPAATRASHGSVPNDVVPFDVLVNNEGTLRNVTPVHSGEAVAMLGLVPCR